MKLFKKIRSFFRKLFCRPRLTIIINDDLTSLTNLEVLIEGVKISQVWKIVATITPKQNTNIFKLSKDLSDCFHDIEYAVGENILRIYQYVNKFSHISGMDNESCVDAIKTELKKHLDACDITIVEQSIPAFDTNKYELTK